MVTDRRRQELDDEYRRYFPPVRKPKAALVQTVIGIVAWALLAFFVALILFDIGMGVLLKLLG
ncbi:MAG TPA: hypothetical protein VFB66_14205 [Tepidisphaeraceae bacterium]|nr:hypothetical protein [Tepidisphaeraceae bacterium]